MQFEEKKSQASRKVFMGVKQRVYWSSISLQRIASGRQSWKVTAAASVKIHDLLSGKYLEAQWFAMLLQHLLRPHPDAPSKMLLLLLQTAKYSIFQKSDKSNESQDVLLLCYSRFMTSFARSGQPATKVWKLTLIVQFPSQTIKEIRCLEKNCYLTFPFFQIVPFLNCKGLSRVKSFS